MKLARRFQKVAAVTCDEHCLLPVPRRRTPEGVARGHFRRTGHQVRAYQGITVIIGPARQEAHRG